jgi:hypothetical protein
VLPKSIDGWSLTSLQQGLVKAAGRLMKHARYYWLLLADSHLTRRMFGAMLGWIPRLPVPGELLIRDTRASDSRSCYDDEMRALVILCHSSHRIVRPAPWSRRHTFRGVGVGPRQAANSIPQSFTAAVTQSTRLRSPRSRFVYSQDSPHSPDPSSERTTRKRPNTIR